VPVTLPLHDRSFDLVLLSNWEDEIVYEPSHTATSSTLEDNNLTTPVNKALESGAWTQSIIWSRNAPFRDFIQLELNEEDIVEDHPQGSSFSPLLSPVLLLICGVDYRDRQTKKAYQSA
jgi:transcription initiation factor TFIID subunit 1